MNVFVAIAPAGRYVFEAIDFTAAMKIASAWSPKHTMTQASPATVDAFRAEATRIARLRAKAVQAGPNSIWAELLFQAENNC